MLVLLPWNELIGRDEEDPSSKYYLGLLHEELRARLIPEGDRGDSSGLHKKRRGQQSQTERNYYDSCSRAVVKKRSQKEKE